VGRRHRVLLLLAGLLAGRAVPGAETFRSAPAAQVLADAGQAVRMAASPEGKVLALQLKSGEVRILDLAGLKETARIPKFCDSLDGLALGQDGKVLVAVSGRSIFTVDLAKGGPPRQIATSPDPVYRIAVFAPLELVALATSGGLRVLNLGTGDAILSRAGDPCLNAVFTPDGAALAVVQGRTVTLFELPNLIETWKSSFYFHPSVLAFSQDGEVLAAGGDLNEVHLLGARDGKLRRKLSLGFSASRVQHLALAPDGASLAVAADRRLLAFEGVGAGEGRKKELKGSGRIAGLALSPVAGALLAAREDAAGLQRWDLDLKLAAPPPAAPAPVRIVQPRIELLGPPADAPRDRPLAILVRAWAPADQPLVEVRLLQDGRPLADAGQPLARGAALPPGAKPWREGEEIRRLELPAPLRDSVLEASGETRYASSPVAVLQLKGSAPPAPGPALPDIAQPEVALLGLAAGTVIEGPAMPIRVMIKTRPDQPVQAVRVLVDGRPVEAAGGERVAGAAEDVRLYSVPVPARDFTLAVFAETAYATSRPAALRLRRAAPEPAKPPPPPAVRVLRPTLALVGPADLTGVTAEVVELVARVGYGPEQPPSRVQVRVDGQPVAVEADTAEPPAPAGPGRLEAVHRLRVPIPGRSCTISLWAETAYADSELALVRVRRTASVPAARPAPPAIVPPQVAILTPARDSQVKEDAVLLTVRVRFDPSQKLTGLRVMLDGNVLPDAALRGALPRQDTAPPARESVPEGLLEETRTFTVPLPPRDCTLGVIAETALADSELATVLVRVAPGGRVDTASLSRLFVLAVGVGKYKDPALSLVFPAKDAGDFSQALQAQKGRLFREVKVNLLADDQATRGNIMDALEWLQRQMTQRDVAMVFLAGHGMNDPASGRFHFLPHDADLNAIKRTMVAGSEITSTLDGLPGKRMLFLDSCHSANVSGKTRGALDLGALQRELEAAGQGVVVFAAASGRQGAQEKADWGNGAFTKAVLEGLGGAADPRHSGRVTVNMLNAYVNRRVKELTDGLQTPIFKKNEELADFALTVAGEGR